MLGEGTSTGRAEGAQREQRASKQRLERTESLLNAIEAILAPGLVAHEFEPGNPDCKICGEGVVYYLHRGIVGLSPEEMGVKECQFCQNLLPEAHEALCAYTCGLCGFRTRSYATFNSHAWRCSGLPFE